MSNYVLIQAAKARECLVPAKSKAAYTKAYEDFQEWRRKNLVNGVDENILLAFFEELKYSPNTLWPKLSMLRSMLHLKEKTDVKMFDEVEAFVKNKNKGYVPKKSEVLSREQLKKFLREAPNDIFLMYKVVLIMEIFGACRTIELVNMLSSDIEDRGSVIVINVLKTKNDINRKFTIIDEEDLGAARLVREYSALRPQGVLRFFVAYRNKKCTLQPVGKNTFGKIPSKVAEWLHLDNPKAYTGHCGRRTSATLVADAGASMTTLKRHGGWKSSSVAEGYLADSMLQKNKVAKMIAGAEGEPSAASVTVPSVSMMASCVAQSSQSLETVFGKSYNCERDSSSLISGVAQSSQSSETVYGKLYNCEHDSSSLISGCNRFSGHFMNCNFYVGSEK